MPKAHEVNIAVAHEVNVAVTRQTHSREFTSSMLTCSCPSLCAVAHTVCVH